MTAPLAAEDRIDALDALRGIALFGVLIVNLETGFRVSIFQQFIGASLSPGLDSVTEQVLEFAFFQKAFCVFSLLFGVGLAVLFDRLSATGRPFYWLARRLAVLLAVGLIHLLLIWNGDILAEYAVAGFLALPFLLLRPKGLLFAAAALLVLYLVGPALYSIPWPSEAGFREHVAAANRVYPVGTWREIRQFGLQELPLALALHAFVLPRTLALFAFGIFLWRVGVVRNAGRFTDEAALAALLGIAVGAALTIAAGPSLALLAPICLALGYAAALWTLAQRPGAQGVLSMFAPIGRMAFTNYVLQSIVLGFVFFGYGLGQFGKMGAAAAFALGALLYAAQVLISRWWLRRYRFGPLEWLWRTLMYGRAQPMRLRSA